MRTTLDIDAPILAAIRSLALQSGKSMGRVASDLLEQALAPKRQGSTRNGVPVFPRTKDAGPATLELVNELRDGDPAP